MWPMMIGVPTDLCRAPAAVRFFFADHQAVRFYAVWTAVEIRLLLIYELMISSTAGSFLQRAVTTMLVYGNLACSDSWNGVGGRASGPKKLLLRILLVGILCTLPLVNLWP